MLGKLPAIALWLAVPLVAEQGILVLRVSNPQQQPLPGVQLSTQGDGSTGPPTDRSGRTRIRLAPQTRPASWVSLQVTRAPRDLVFISPWDGRVRVPPFENESENFAPLVLAVRGDRAVLEMGNALASLAARVNAAAAPEQKKLRTAEELRKEALAEVSRQFGLDREDVHRAILALSSRSDDPYERGMSSLYRGDYPTASRQLSQALEKRENAPKVVAAGVLNAAFFLGQSLFEQARYIDAAGAFEKALEQRPDDVRALNLLGLSLLKAGRAAQAEPYLRRAVELQGGSK